MSASVTPVRRVGPAEQAQATLVGWWLRAFGPGTEADRRWWLGSTLTVVHRALEELGAVPVDLDGRIGHLLPDDTDPAPPVEPWAALLPVMDPTVMAWQERGWYVGEHHDRVFDSAGNAAPTAWWDGRIVGTWSQHDDGTVVPEFFEDVDREARRRIDTDQLHPHPAAPQAARRSSTSRPGRQSTRLRRVHRTGVPGRDRALPAKRGGVPAGVHRDRRPRHLYRMIAGLVTAQPVTR